MSVDILVDRVCFELSLKPFKVLEEGAVRAVARELFTQWLPLIGKAASVAVMLWSSDGSEILDYDGNEETSFEWAYFIGIANPASARDARSDVISLHIEPALYTEKPARMTYGWLKRICAALREEGTRITGKPVEIGTTFDPGPEFAKSDFKYERHKEIAPTRLTGSRFFWVACNTVLSAEKRAYAGYPEGIPEGTAFGTFLGRQSRIFMEDMGIDYIWFSNGFAFALHAWSATGEVFDGERFDAARIGPLQEEILSFWTRFRLECPKNRIETRGSNLSTGMDIAAHGSPVRAIYKGGFDLAAPPNSPWAALNGNYGLELVGWMSHIAELPDSGLMPFRFYTHDPWWLNSPWFDRYGRWPHDIYLPLAIARIDENGDVTRPTSVNFLSADNSYGDLPDRCPIEVTPHIIRALDDFPDEPGLVTWVYPFDELHDMALEGRVDEVFFGDWYVCGAVNRGLPLGTVVSSRSFTALAETGKDTFKRTVLFSPVPDGGSALEYALLRAVEGGANLLLYGPTAYASEALLARIGVAHDAQLEGEFAYEGERFCDSARHGTVAGTFEHRALVSAGGIGTSYAGGAELIALARQGVSARAIATFAKGVNGQGSIGWVRGTYNYRGEASRLPKACPPSEAYPVDALPRQMLSLFGITLGVDKPSVSTREPLVLCARHKWGLMFSGYSPQATVALRLRLPMGAPILCEGDAVLEGGVAVYHLPRAWHHECRVLVAQENGEISCQESHPRMPDTSRRIVVRGLDRATLRFIMEPGGHGAHFSAFVESDTIPRESMAYEVEDDGRVAVLTDVSGDIQISWKQSEIAPPQFSAQKCHWVPVPDWP